MTEGKSQVSERYFSGEYLEATEDWHEGDAPWKAANIRQMIDRMPTQPRLIADVGCGVGAVLVCLQEHLPEDTRFVGFDVSPQAIEIAKPRGNDRLNFNQSTPHLIDGQKFDLLIANDVFEHVPDYLGFLEGLVGLSRRFIFHIPLDLSCATVYQEERILNRRKNVGHLHYFIKSTALETLRDTGYKIDDYFYTDSGGQIPNPDWKHRVRNMPRYFAYRFNQDWAARVLGGFSLLVLCSPAES